MAKPLILLPNLGKIIQRSAILGWDSEPHQVGESYQVVITLVSGYECTLDSPNIEHCKDAIRILNNETEVDIIDAF